MSPGHIHHQQAEAKPGLSPMSCRHSLPGENGLGKATPWKTPTGQPWIVRVGTSFLTTGEHSPQLSWGSLPF